jgi:hypothetical protein
MKEADVRAQVNRSLKTMGYWAVTQRDVTYCTNCGRAGGFPPSGKPDVMVVDPTGLLRAFQMEVKVYRASETSFPFSRIEDSQRSWLSDWVQDGGLSVLALGAIRPHGTREYLDHLWMVPWHEWLSVEKTVSKHQESLPLENAHRVALRGLEAVNCLRQWEWVRANSIWQPSGEGLWPTTN